jgi:integrase
MLKSKHYIPEGYKMRLREAFSLYKRKTPCGRTVYYFQTYDAHGRRTCGHSTGQSTKTGAREYCNKLLREGLLLPKQKKVPTFAEYAVGWWDFETCEYLHWRQGHKKMSRNYAQTSRRVVENHLIPAFGKMRLDEITGKMVDNWMTEFRKKEIDRKAMDKETGQLVSKKYDNGTINGFYRVLSVMLGDAVRRDIISVNPCSGVKELIITEKKITILTPDEVKKFFAREWYSDLHDKICFMANKLSACTGMRIGEVLGLRGEYLFDTFVKVCAQYNKWGYGDTKSHKERDVPIPEIMKSGLEELKALNGSGFLFSTDKGATPVSRFHVREIYEEVLGFIGIDNIERVRRGITFHSWRHFFNTTLVMANVTDRKVQSVTGHSSGKMTTKYQHLINTELTEVIDVQNNLFVDGKGGSETKPKKKPKRKKAA